MSRLIATLQDNIRSANTDVNTYAYWLTGANTKNSALEQYDLLRQGYVRAFVLQLPKFVNLMLPDESKKFKHMIEYGNVGIDGIQGYTVEFSSATGGYVGSTVEIPTNVKDDTSSVTIKLYETQGSLIRTYIDFWITGTIDPYTGLSHYHGARETSVGGQASMYQSQAHQTMELLVVATDPTGDQAEYSCLLTNMFPKASDHAHFNFEPGSHDLVQISVEFTCNKYMSSQINYIGSVALKKFQILKNFLNFYSGYTAANVEAQVGSTAGNIADWKDGDVDLTTPYMKYSTVSENYTV
jgi:hypothetical protein